MPLNDPGRKTLLLSTVLALVLTQGCRDQGIRSYTTPKEDGDSVQEARATQDRAAEPAPSAPSWTAPTDWKSQPASGLRLASYTVSDSQGETADISVVNFGGTGGDELANINRWRGQLKLGPIAQDDLAAAIEVISTGAGDFSMADLQAEQPEAGKPLSRIVGAWLRRGRKVWFFKMMGPADLVGAQKKAFEGFLRSVAFASSEHGGSPEAAVNTNDLPKSMGSAPDLTNLPAPGTLPGGAALKSAEGSSLKWTAPATWTVKPATSMRKGSYALGQAGEVDLSVTAFPGDVGGPIANVNRWLGQVGLAPIQESDLPQYTSHIEANGLVFFLADTGSKNPSQPKRIFAAVVAWQGNSWFFKLSGPAEQVGAAKPEFIEFLRSVRAP